MQEPLQVSYAPRSRREGWADRVSSSSVEENTRGLVTLCLQHD